MEVLGHYIDAMGPFLKYFPDGVGSVINKLFELLTLLPFVLKVLLLMYWNRYLLSFYDMQRELGCEIFNPLIVCRIPQQVLLDMQGCRFVHHLFELPKLLTKAFCLI